VRSLEEGITPAGRHRITWDGRDDRGRQVASGVYWLRLEAGTERRAVRAVLVH
jgi:flagellar hook assembly protein FlgD